MTTSQEPHHRNSTNSHSIARSASAYRWEIEFFLCAYALLVIQVLLFYYDINSLANGRVAVAVYAAVESFVVKRLAYLTLSPYISRSSAFSSVLVPQRGYACI